MNLNRALFWGRYSAVIAEMEHIGVPIDLPMLEAFRKHWEGLKRAVIAEVDAEFGIYDGTSFRAARFERRLRDHGILWPRLPSGAPMLNDKTFEAMSFRHPMIRRLRELRQLLSKLDTLSLSVGSDGRNRSGLMPFGTKTGRNAPSTTRFIFGAPKWLRGLIRPEPDSGVAYIDYSAQEIGIAAAFSGDPAMRHAYASGDPHMEFAIMSGGAPPGATKATHGEIRELYKQCLLAVQYCMEALGLAQRLGVPISHAEFLLHQHRLMFPTFWRWSDAALDYALQTGKITTALGWPLHMTSVTKPRTVRNYPMQGAGSDLLRVAVVLGRERGVRICAPIHDAVLIEARLDQLDWAIAEMQAAMVEASRLVLNGFELRTEVKVVRYPSRFTDDRSVEMWDRALRIVADLSGGLHATV